MMAQQTIGLGTTANDGTGDDLRAAGTKINANFTELYGAAVTNLAETIRDTIATALVAGTNVTITPNDGSDTITIAASGGGGTSPTNEEIRDLVASFIVAGSNITVTHNDAGDTLTIAASGGGGSAPATHPGFVSGRYYPVSGLGNANNSGSVVGADTLRAVPFRVEADVTISDIALRLAAAGVTANQIVGIYSSVNGRPGAKLATSAVVATTTGDTTGAVKDFNFAGNAVLTRGTYWFAFNANAGTTWYGVSNTVQSAGALLGATSVASVSGSSTQITGITSARTYDGTLPADLSATSWTDSTTNSIPFPFLKVA